MKFTEYLFALFLLLIPGFSCLLPGFSCMRGALEIHSSINLTNLDKYFKKIEKIQVPFENFDFDKLEEYKFYEYNKDLFIAANKKELIIGTKVIRYEGKFPNEKCIFITNYSKFDLKKIIRDLVEKKVLNFNEKTMNEVFKYAKWGYAGNIWIEVEGNRVKLNGIKGCKLVPILQINEEELKKHVVSNEILSYTLILIVFVISLLILLKHKI